MVGLIHTCYFKPKSTCNPVVVQSILVAKLTYNCSQTDNGLIVTGTVGYIQSDKKNVHSVFDSLNQLSRVDNYLYLYDNNYG